MKKIAQAFGFCGFEAARHDQRILRLTMEKQVERYCRLSHATAPGLAGAIKLMKYKLAAFFSAMMRQTIPDRPWKDGKIVDNPLALAGGAFLRFAAAKSRLFDSRLPECATLAKTIQQLKKGFERPDEKMLRDAEKTTFKELTQKPQQNWLLNLDPIESPSWADLSEAEFLEDPRVGAFTQATFAAQIRRTVREIYENADRKYDVEARLRPFFPSTSANYINSRAGCGAVGSILRDHPDLLEGLREPDGGVMWRKVLERDESIRPAHVGVDETWRYELVSTAASEKFDVFYTRLVKKALDEVPVAVPLALPESLKTRVITKGPPLLATAMKPLQKFLWSVLKEHRVFQLIGRPVDERVLLDVIGRELAADESFLSGDYSNATNELRSWVSEQIADELSSVLALTGEEAILLKRSLTQHVLEDPETEEHLPQQNGQLMGSVTSFPVLCIANASLCRYVMEKGTFANGDRRQSVVLPLSRIRLLVNGDDCLFPANEVVRRYWEQVGKFVGLTPSIGKYYFSKTFCDINSTTFVLGDELPQVWPRKKENVVRLPRDGERTVFRMNPFRLIKYVNFGLLYGMKRSGGKLTQADVFSPLNSMGSRHRELFRLCPSSSWDDVHQAFLNNHRDLLKQMGSIPFYLPEWLGGLGLVGTPSSRDVHLAFGALSNWKNLKLRPTRFLEKMPWRVRQCAQRYLPTQKTRMLTRLEKTETTRVMGLLSIATLFDSGLSLSDLYSSETEDGLDAFKVNLRFWQYLNRKNVMRKPTMHDVLSNQKLEELAREFNELPTLDEGGYELFGSVPLNQSEIDEIFAASLWTSREVSCGVPLVVGSGQSTVEGDFDLLLKRQHDRDQDSLAVLGVEPLLSLPREEVPVVFGSRILKNKKVYSLDESIGRAIADENVQSAPSLVDITPVVVEEKKEEYGVYIPTGFSSLSDDPWSEVEDSHIVVYPDVRPVSLPSYRRKIFERSQLLKEAQQAFATFQKTHRAVVDFHTWALEHGYDV
jgi:hypothetical protein